jgi:hypothetical protein
MPGLVKFQWIVFIVVAVWAIYDMHYWERIGRLSRKQKKELGIDIDEDED